MSDLKKQLKAKRDELLRLHKRECFGLYQSEISHMENGFLKGFDAAANELVPKLDSLQDKIYHESRLCEEYKIERDSLKARLETAIKALEFYADEKNSEYSDDEFNQSWCYSTARQALKDIKGDGAK